MKIFEINGYFKDTQEPFAAELVAEFDDAPDSMFDVDFFHFGLSEGDIKYAIDEKKPIDNDFYIVSYLIIEENA